MPHCYEIAIKYCDTGYEKVWFNLLRLCGVCKMSATAVLRYSIGIIKFDWTFGSIHLIHYMQQLNSPFRHCEGCERTTVFHYPREQIQPNLSTHCFFVFPKNRSFRLFMIATAVVKSLCGGCKTSPHSSKESWYYWFSRFWNF